MTSKRWRVALFGTGRAGCEVARACVSRPDLDLVAVVSQSAGKVGSSAGELMGVADLDLAVEGEITLDLAARADVLLHTGLGSAAERAELLGSAAEMGLSAITVNGLVHPPTALGGDGAAALDARARAGGARIVGTGVNPGFLLDVLPAVWASMTSRQGPIAARRVSDIRHWGKGALEEEVLLGADPADVADSGALSLAESVALIGDSTGQGLDRVASEFEPLAARSRRQFGARVVEPGQVVGFRRRGIGYAGSEPRVEVDWLAIFCIDPAVDSCREEATVQIGGENWIRAGGAGLFLGDPYPATAARALNAIAPLLSKQPGLWRPDQLPVSA